MEARAEVPGICPAHFDHTSEDHARRWPEIYRELRQHCPRAWSENHDGYWVATLYDDVVSILQSPDFTAEKTFDPETGIARGGNLIPPFPVQPVIPIEAENSAWRGYRMFLRPKFTKEAAERYRPFAEGVARTLIDRRIESGTIDFVEDLTSPLPALVTMRMFGYDLDDWTEFSEPIHKYMYYRPDHPEYGDIVRKLGNIIERIGREAEDRKARPRDDMMSYIANGEVNGRPLSDTEINQMSLNLIFGGVDTTTALTSSVLRFLGQNPELKQRLVDDPALRPIAREECLRYFAPVHGVARHAMCDVDINGWKFREGDSVFLAIASANRDPGMFEDADSFQIDRAAKRHIGFGVGIHVCIGLFLARMMFDVMLDEVLNRLPDYRMIDEECEPYTSVDKVNGWARLPATFTPGPTLGGGVAL